MYFISTIFYKYDDLQNNEKNSILNLCDGDFSILISSLTFKVSYAEVFSKFGPNFIKISKIVIPSFEWVVNHFSTIIFRNVIQFLVQQTTLN